MSELQATGPGGISKDEKQWGMIVHLAALSGFIIPFGNIIGPLVVWAVKKEELPFVAEQGKEAINFQISMMIYAFISAVLTLLLIGFLGLIVVALAALILPIIAGLKAGDGHEYRYPATIRLLK